MEVVLAKHAGFCFGVKRAVDKVYEQIATGKKIYTYGPIIHNETVVSDLQAKGVVVIHSMEELERLGEGTVIIRSHGVPRSVCDKIRELGLECADATCPFVKRIHNIVEAESGAGKRIVIIGNEGHPEVEGIRGWAKPGSTTVLGSVEEVRAFCGQLSPKEAGPICVVAQTTFNLNKFQELVEILGQNGYDTSVVNTICSATEERQTEAKEVAAKVDAMIVIGGRHSSNTQKLYEICRQECPDTCLIQTLDDLQLELSEAVRLVGITAGASTPNKLIEEVRNYVGNEF